MKYILLTIMLIFGATSVSAGNHSKDQYTKKDCDELFDGIAGLIGEADKHWDFLKDNPDDSPESVKHAVKIQWLTDVAANYTTIYEAFCDKKTNRK